jgi:hypothetical protein
MSIEVYITTRNGRAFVWRVVNGQEDRFAWESARNASDLEHDALEFVVERGGYVTHNAKYPCPPELAERALWHDSVEMIF